MDKFRIDDQKIFYFPERIGKWLGSENNWEILKKIYPIYIEVSPSGGCNHRCTFCALDYLEYKPSFLDYDKYLSFIKIASKKGVKSIMFGGEGEPLLHPKINEIAYQTKKQNIDIAMTTNGSLMTKLFLDKSLKYFNWIKVSLDAGTNKTHKKIHRTNIDDFDEIISNIKYVVKLKKQKKYKCSLGVQFLLLPENAKEVVSFAKKAKTMGVDYFVVKPYSQGLFSKNKLKPNYSKYSFLTKALSDLSNDKFSAVFRSQAFETATRTQQNYKHCQVVPFFWAYLMTNGDVYSCSAFLGNKKFCLGNINKVRFDKIWEGSKRKQNWELIKKMSIKECRTNCRMDKVNNYLNNIKNPPNNHTFI